MGRILEIARNSRQQWSNVGSTPASTLGVLARPCRTALGVFLSTLVLTGLMLCANAGRSWGQAADTLWFEGFEGDWESDWHDDYGTWQVGTPTSGPNAAYGGQRCAATVLAGDYTEGVDSKLIRHQSFVVPPAGQRPRLRFWQWFSINSDDYGLVMIQVGGGTWQTLETYDRHSSAHWTRGFVDLTPFAGATVNIGFHFHSSASFFCNPCVGPGWYIDDVMVETGDRVFPATENWESGFKGWYAEHGLWEVGTATSGPDSAYSGTNVVATILDGNYYENLDSRLVSPPLTVPTANQNPRLRFWHWYSFASDDYGQVQVRTIGGSWQTLETFDRHSGYKWTRGFVDLAAYADSTIELAFNFHSAASFFCNPCVSAGWYIDDLAVDSDPLILQAQTTWEGADGVGGWYADRGLWEVGRPTSGPDSAYSPPNVAGTLLGGNYFENLDSRLISPPVLVLAPGGRLPIFRFRNWYSFASDDAGYVQLRVRSGPWQTILGPYTGTSSGWGYPYYNLSAYTDSVIQVAFYFYSASSFFCNPCVAAGWYVDDVLIDSATPTLLAQQSATQDANDVVVTWRTTLESDVAAFRVYRSSLAGGFDATSPAIPARGSGEYSWRDTSVKPGHYTYRIVEVSRSGAEASVGAVAIEVTETQPHATFLATGEPNPFRARTTLRFGLARPGEASIVIYDLNGRRIRNLSLGTFTAGSHSRSWDGRDDSGRRLPSGMYYVLLKTADAIIARRLMLVE